MYFMLPCAGAEQREGEREGEREAEMAVKREEMRGCRGSEAEMSVERERGGDGRGEREAGMTVERMRLRWP